jgi:hypothetical protein
MGTFIFNLKNYRTEVIFMLGFVIMCIFGVFSLYTNLKKRKEGFEWSSESKKDFLYNTEYLKHNFIFDADTIERNQASEEEVEYFNKNGMWPWSQETKDIFTQAILKNPYIKILPDAEIKEARRVYNESTILQILSHQTKEGHFLIHGVKVLNPNYKNYKEELPDGFGDFAYNSGLKQDLRKDTILCNMDSYTLERTHYTGKEGIFVSQTSEITPVDYNTLESAVPGFQFINCPCNPCVALKEKPDYSCPFRLKLKNDDNPDNVSDVWKVLWGI